MKFALLLLCLAGSPALADEVFVATVSVTTSASTAVRVPTAKRLIVYCTTSNVRYVMCPTSTCSAGATDFPLPQYHFETWSSRARFWVSFIASTGTDTCTIYRVER